MKAAFNNLLRYLLCLASVVLAAPNQSTLCTANNDKPASSDYATPFERQNPVFTQAKERVNSETYLLEGSTRFAIW